jgi:hypothetical protein
MEPKATGASEKMVRTPVGKMNERLREIRRLQEVLSQPNFEPVATAGLLL